jgi:hypothetical protein
MGKWRIKFKRSSKTGRLFPVFENEGVTRVPSLDSTVDHFKMSHDIAGVQAARLSNKVNGLSPSVNAFWLKVSREHGEHWGKKLAKMLSKRRR